MVHNHRGYHSVSPQTENLSVQKYIFQIYHGSAFCSLPYPYGTVSAYAVYSFRLSDRLRSHSCHSRGTELRRYSLSLVFHHHSLDIPYSPFSGLPLRLPTAFLSVDLLLLPGTLPTQYCFRHRSSRSRHPGVLHCPRSHRKDRTFSFSPGCRPHYRHSFYT